MNRITQHIPSFADGPVVERIMAEFDDGYLEKVSFINDWKGSVGFIRFSIASDTTLTLMAEFMTGKSWVVGFLGKDIPSMPRWRGGGRG